MITPEYLSEVVRATERRVEDLNSLLIRKIVGRITSYFERTGKLSVNPASVYDALKMRESGKALNDAINEIAREMPELQLEVKQAFYKTADKIAVENMEFYQDVININKIDVDLPNKATLSKNEMNILNSMYRRTNGEVRNITKTTASMCQQTFINTVDKAMFSVQHGAARNDAICNAIDELSAHGIKTVQYPGGRTDKIEVAIARAVRTGINMANADIWLTGCAETGINYVLVSSHLGARVTDRNDYTDHAHWQGKVYKLDWKSETLKKYNPIEGQKTFRTKIRDFMIKKGIKKDFPDFIRECGYGQMLGICGINCRHTFSAFYPGININNNIQYDSEENRKQYELQQRQRAYERKIREYGRRISSFEELERSSDVSLAEVAHERREDIKNRLLAVKSEYSKFCKSNNLKSEKWRRYIATDKNIASPYKNGILTVRKTTLTNTPNSITQTISKNGGISRNYYDENKKQFKQISNNNHGTPKSHPWGENGEHAHDYVYDDDGKLIGRPGRDLREDERKENSDIL